jgi:hypothetical protein
MSSRKERNAESAKRSRDRQKNHASALMVGVGKAIIVAGKPKTRFLDNLEPSVLKQLLLDALTDLDTVSETLAPLYTQPCEEIVTLASLDLIYAPDLDARAHDFDFLDLL